MVFGEEKAWAGGKREEKAKGGASPQHTRLEEGHLDRLQRETRGGFGWWRRKEECLKMSTSSMGKRLPGTSTVDFLFILLIISLWALWISYSYFLLYHSSCIYLVVSGFHLLLGYIIALFSLSSSLGIHSKINLDMVRVMPPTMKPIDFNMKWVPTYWVFCLFVCHFERTLFGVVHLCIWYLNPYFVSRSHLWGLL